MRSIVLSGLLSLATAEVAVLLTTVYLHRHITHRSVRLCDALAGSCRCLTWLLLGISPDDWSTVHLAHHRAPDTSADPHSPVNEGFLRVTLLLPLLYRRFLKRQPADESHLTGRWTHGFLGPVAVAAAVGLLLSPAAGAIWLLLHGGVYNLLFGLLTSVGHSGVDQGGTIGRAKDVRWLSIPLGGEFLHLSHHLRPQCYFFGPGPWSPLDPGGLFVSALLKLHLATVSTSQPLTVVKP